MRNITCVLASETWEKNSSKKYQKEVERMFELEGLRMISKLRKFRRGGGVRIIADITQISIIPLDIQSGNLEIVWALIKPLEESVVKEIITFSFYLPPKSRMKSKMNDHIITTLHQLLTRFPRAGIMGGGDRNDWNVSPVLDAIPRFQNLQHLPTLNGKNLDVFLSNLGCFYASSVVVPPLLPDDPTSGKPGDHSVPVLYPLDNHNIQTKEEYSERTTRPLPDSGVRLFGTMMINQDWDEVKDDDTTTQQDEALQSLLTRMLDDSCPTKTVRLRLTDKPFITRELKILDRQRKRAYRQVGKSQKYLLLNDRYERKLKAAAQNYLDKNVRAIKESDPGKAYSILKRLGAQPGETDACCFEVKEHCDLGLTASEAADRIAQKFSEISQEFPPLKVENLPSRVFHKIQNSKNQQKPMISQRLVEDKIDKANNTKGGVPGDLPVKLAKEFGPELAVPATKIFNNIVQTGKWPVRWKVENGIALNKVKPLQPESESELRIISMTPFLSKSFESIVMDWLLHFVGEKLDWSQFGGIKGSSSSHYLIDMITYILYNQDLKEPQAVVATMVDFEKAFNRQNHHILITKLSDMGTPGWLLKIVIGFLEERILIVTHKGKKSEPKEMPGGGPQGTILGMFLFLILINCAGFPNENRELGIKITQAIHKRKEIENKHWKYVDDLTVAEAINLKNKLTNDDDDILEKPLEYHSRTNEILPNESSQVQKQLSELNAYATENEMRINIKKTKVMLFNTARKHDFTPTFMIDDVLLEVVEEFKLLGIKITSDLKWNNNTKYITTKAYKRLWILKRLKALGANQAELLDTYTKQVRSVLEYGSVVWHAGLTMLNSSDIERVQKTACAIILGQKYYTYQAALTILGLKPLNSRREALCLKFAKKSLKSEKYSSWFVPDTNQTNTRRKVKPGKEVQCRTTRFRKSALPYLTALLNKSEII